jgi:hypothetical protein
MKLEGNATTRDASRAASRWPRTAALGLAPIFTWELEGLDVQPLEDALAEAYAMLAEGEQLDLELGAECPSPAELAELVRAWIAKRLEERAAPVEPTADRSDPLFVVARDVCGTNEAAMIRLLADDGARQLLAWIGEKIARSHRATLGPMACALAARRGPLVLAPLRARAVEIAVDQDLAAEEARIRYELEAPQRAAAARLAALAAARRAELAAELEP